MQALDTPLNASTSASTPMPPLTQSIVVFSKNYLPINQVNIRRAILLLVTGKAEPLALSDKDRPSIPVHSPTQTLMVPPQIRLTIHHTERVWRIPAVTRREVLRRDKHRCQYCGTSKHLTMDHVIPRSKGGKHSWDNIVTACADCNSRKGDRTPTQAHMPLAREPKAPAHPMLAFAEEFWRLHKQRQEN